MSWITAIITLIRALWPFLREAVFGRESVKAWLKKNFFSLVWLLFVIAMMVVVLKLSATIHADQVQIRSLNTNNTALQKSFTADEATIANYKQHPELLCPKPAARSKEVGTVGVTSSVYPPHADPPKPNAQDKEIDDMLRQIQSEEH
jgi:hypothetical protein